jgi:hypothetical protein
VVREIFDRFIDGQGIYAIAEELTRAGIACPSAHDAARNKHRSGIAWSKGAVRVILTNPRYTGHQVWNRQRTDEVLLDVDNVALGHAARMRWNPADTWITSERDVHPAIITTEQFEQAQTILAGRGSRTAHKPHRRPRAYALRGVLLCGLCDRRMTGNWNNEQAYYRCRFPAEYALANRVDHPKTIYLREADVLGQVDNWLSSKFAPASLDATLAELAEQAASTIEDTSAQAEAARARIADCDRKIAQYRASLDAGGDPAVIGPWIAEIQAKRVAAQVEIGKTSGQARMSKDAIAAIISALGDLTQIVRDADPADKAEIYTQLGLTLKYRPQKRLVEATVRPGPHMCKGFVSEGRIHQKANTSHHS